MIKDIIKENIEPIIDNLSIDTSKEELIDNIINVCDNKINDYIQNNYIDITTYKRIAADFDNMRKRLIITNDQKFNSYKDKLIEEICNFIDDFDIILQYSKDQGIINLRDKFVNYLNKNDITLYYPNDCEFDSNLHDAVSTLQIPGKENKVISCIKCGINHKDNIIRHAQVVVGN